MPACAGMTLVLNAVRVKGFAVWDSESRQLLARREWNPEKPRRIACIYGKPVGSTQI
jgi:hypothetical protein